MVSPWYTMVYDGIRDGMRMGPAPKQTVYTVAPLSHHMGEKKKKIYTYVYVYVYIYIYIHSSPPALHALIFRNLINQSVASRVATRYGWKCTRYTIER